MWKCPKCGFKGYLGNKPLQEPLGKCPKCKEVHILERYDPLEEPEITISTHGKVNRKNKEKHFDWSVFEKC